MGKVFRLLTCYWHFNCDLLLNIAGALSAAWLLSNSQLVFSPSVNSRILVVKIIMPGTKSGSSRTTVEQCDELRRKMQLLGM